VKLPSSSFSFSLKQFSQGKSAASLADPYNNMQNCNKIKTDTHNSHHKTSFEKIQTSILFHLQRLHQAQAPNPKQKAKERN
jgi:hypothetical protein